MKTHSLLVKMKLHKNSLLLGVLLLISCTPKENKLYQSGKVWHYVAEYRSADSLFNYEIQMIPGGMFLLQQKIKWVVTLPDSISTNEFLFRSESTTSFKENDSKNWLYSPRTHQFSISSCRYLLRIIYPLH